MGMGRGRVSEEENGERRNPAQEWLLAFYGFLTYFFLAVTNGALAICFILKPIKYVFTHLTRKCHTPKNIFLSQNRIPADLERGKR